MARQLHAGGRHNGDGHTNTISKPTKTQDYDNPSSVIANSGNATRILAFVFIGLNIAFGYYVSFLRFNKGRESNVKEMFSAAFSENYRRNLGIMLLTCMYIILWSLLLVIPDIVKAYSYAMTPYIAEEHPELSAEECIKKSMIMMSGPRWICSFYS